MRTRWKRGDKFLVRHKDPAIAVVEKQAGLLTVKPESGKGPDLMSLLKEFLTPNERQRTSLYAVHRLDRTVSGVLVFARTYPAQQHLIHQFAAHDVERRYVAAVQGILPDDSGTFESYLASEPGTLRMYSHPQDQGKRAVTHWTVRERFEAADVTLVDVELETGLRNQIRVHFSEAGFPLLGEKKYLEDSPSASQGSQRIFLHAAVLGFRHPANDKPVRWEAPMPPDLHIWAKRFAHGKR